MAERNISENGLLTLNRCPIGMESVKSMKADLLNGFIAVKRDHISTQTMVNGLDKVNGENKENENRGEHMVQSQLGPAAAYQYATQVPQPALIEEYHQPTVVASQPPPSSISADHSQQQFKEQTTIYTCTAPAVTPNGGVEQQTQTDIETTEIPGVSQPPISPQSPSAGPKRLHVSNIPFRFREADLRNLLGQFGPILDVEIIFNERGSKGFGFVTFANNADADRAREKLNGTVVEGRKVEVNNATARVMTKKTVVAAPTIPNAAALRGVALTRGRATAALAARGAYTAAAAAAAAAALRHPAPLATATALPYAAGVYQDPFLAATYAAADRYQLVTTQPYAAAAYGTTARYAIPVGAAGAQYAAAAAGLGRELAADPYLGHSIGPVAGYGVQVQGVHPEKMATVYRGGYQRFAPY